MKSTERRVRDVSVVRRYLNGEKVIVIALECQVSEAAVMKIVRAHCCPFRVPQKSHIRRPKPPAPVERVGLYDALHKQIAASR